MSYFTTLGKQSNQMSKLYRQRGQNWARGHIAKIRQEELHQESALRRRLGELDRSAHLKALNPHAGLVVRQTITGDILIIRLVEERANKPPIMYVKGRREPVNPLTLERV